jgi:hypothetical protein
MSHSYETTNWEEPWFFLRPGIWHALQLTDEEPIELYTELHPHLISSVNLSDTWWDFQISSISDGMPCTRAKGQIRLEPLAAGTPVLYLR